MHWLISFKTSPQPIEIHVYTNHPHVCRVSTCSTIHGRVCCWTRRTGQLWSPRRFEDSQRCYTVYKSETSPRKTCRHTSAWERRKDGKRNWSRDTSWFTATAASFNHSHGCQAAVMFVVVMRCIANEIKMSFYFDEEYIFLTLKMKFRQRKSLYIKCSSA